MSLHKQQPKQEQMQKRVTCEEEAVREIKNLTSKLNEQIGLAATYYGIEARVSDIDASTMGAKAKNHFLSIELLKVL